MSSVYSLLGPKGAAKSTFALTIPGRKYAFDLELGLHRAESRFTPEQKADSVNGWETWKPPPPDIESLLYTKGERLTGRMEKWVTFTRQFLEVLQRDDIRVVALDTWKEIYKYSQFGRLQQLQDGQLKTAYEKLESRNKPTREEFEANGDINWRQQLQQIEYGTPYSWLDNLVYLARNFEKDLVLVNHDRPVYATRRVDGQLKEVQTGEFELDGYKATERLSDWVISTEILDPPMHVDGTDTIHYFKGTIRKSPVGAELVGMPLFDLSYQGLAQLSEGVLGRSVME